MCHQIADFRPFMRESAFVFISLWSEIDNSLEEKSFIINVAHGDSNERKGIRDDHLCRSKISYIKSQDCHTKA